VIRSAYEHVALIDTSAVLALLNPAERFHADARLLFAETNDLTWAALDVTSHETYTRARYRPLATRAALEHYSFLRNSANITTHRFQPADEPDAYTILDRYSDHAFSFHDALCAAAMKRLGIIKVFTFDRDFAVMGFVVLPGLLA